MHGRTTRSPASAGKSFGIHSQLPGGNGSRQQNGRRNSRKQCGLADLSHHGSKLLSLKNRTSVFIPGPNNVYGGSETQDPRVAPFISTQEHAPLHGWVALQRPLQTPIRAGCLFNCRAETVPAHRTLITRAAKSVALIFLPMIRSPFKQKSSGCRGIRFSKLFFRWSERPRVPDAPAGISTEYLAEAWSVAMDGGTACASANRKQIGRCL